MNQTIVFLFLFWFPHFIALPLDSEYQSKHYTFCPWCFQLKTTQANTRYQQEIVFY